jgi:tRNA pseudouridine55 synthase
VLLLDKPLGLSSNQALQKAKWLLRAEKAGHTGTLDPLATGVLPLCFGSATKFSQLHLDADKTYEAGARLGVKTATGDAEGAVIAERPVAVGADDLARVQSQFTGAIRQVPPMHSALKKDGRALYEYAREGIEVERAPRDVVIYRLALASTSARSARTSARRSAAAPTSLRCAELPPAASLPGNASPSRRSRPWTRTSGWPACCRPKPW